MNTSPPTEAERIAALENRVTRLEARPSGAVIEPVLRLIYADPHSWSTRPCQTCSSITSMVGAPFGCDLFRKQREPR
jgi:hypothetical protein